MSLSLKVPWYQKQQALEYGAIRDPLAGIWYVPDGLSEEYHRFEQWFPLKSPGFILPGGPILFSTSIVCPQCGKDTDIVGLGTDGAYTRDTWTMGCWVYDFELGHLFNVTAMDDRLKKLLKKEAPSYFRDWDFFKRGKHWLNHCRHCETPVFEHLLYSTDGYFCEDIEKKVFQVKNLNLPFFTLLKCSRYYGYALEAIYDQYLERK